jgi:ABC-type branched-subunit amino acid transport system substrate-binding protein
VQGAIFPSGFFIDNESDVVNDFYDRYMENFEEEPGILAATGFDTIRFLMNIVNIGSFNTRKSFQKELVGYYDYQGLTGLISFDKQGEVKKDPFLLTVAGRRFRILP